MADNDQQGGDEQPSQLPKVPQQRESEPYIVRKGENPDIKK